jgi:hypothetical protein
MELDAVEARGDRIGRRAPIILEKARYLVHPQRPRLGIRLAALIGMRLERRCRRGGGDRRFAAEEARMHDPAHMPELAEDAAARLVHRVHHRLPRLHLLLGPVAGRIGPTEALPAHSGRLGDDEAGRRALAVVVDHQLGRHMLARGAAAGHGRHDDTVGAEDGAELDGIEERRHEASLTGTGSAP